VIRGAGGGGSGGRGFESIFELTEGRQKKGQGANEKGFRNCME
jgi:hypothetical protein